MYKCVFVGGNRRRPALLAPHKKRLRRKEGSEQKSIQEIIKLIKEYEPDNLPIFVAKSLKKLPPVTFDYIDVTSFLKEMTLVKQELATLKAKNSNDSDIHLTSYTADIASLKSDIEDLKTILKNVQESNNTLTAKCLQQEIRNTCNDGQPASTSCSADAQTDSVQSECTPRAQRQRHTPKPVRPNSHSQLNKCVTSTEPVYTPTYRDMLL